MDVGEERGSPAAAAGRPAAATDVPPSPPEAIHLAAALPQSPPQQPATQHHSLTRRIEATVGCLTTASQLLIWQRAATAGAGLSASGHAHQGLQVALNAALMLEALYLPHTWWLSFRVPIVAAIRFAIVLVPSHRNAQGGMAPLLLRRAAAPGWRGALADWLRVAAGMRVLGHVLVGALLPQPLLAVLVQQAALMLLISRPVEYCATPLLIDPVSQQRISSAVAVLDALPSLLAFHVAGAAGSANGAARACVALLVWQQFVLGVMVPLLFQAFTHRAYLPPPPPINAAQPAQRPAGWRRAPAALRQAWCSADAALTELCTGEGFETIHLLFAAWLLLGNIWLLCGAAAARAFPA